MSFFVYIIQSEKDQRFYIGSTGNLEERLKKHNCNGVKSTKFRGPWRLVYKEFFKTRIEATKREKEMKSYKGGNAFKKLIVKD